MIQDHRKIKIEVEHQLDGFAWLYLISQDDTGQHHKTFMIALSPLSRRALAKKLEHGLLSEGRDK